MPGYLPTGSLPDLSDTYGYQLKEGYPIERLTDRGMEAQLVFVGPSQNRFWFLNEIFGTWQVSTTGNPPDTACCATALSAPRCYSLYYYSGAGGAIYDNLWPDTFDIRPLENVSPYYDPLTAPTLDDQDPDYRYRIEWGIWYTCASEITVNYRSKRMAFAAHPNPVLAQPWPDFLYQLSNCSDTEDNSCLAASLPVVEDYTYIDYVQRSQSEFQTIPGRYLVFDVTEPDWPPGDVGDTKVPEDINVPINITTTDIEVTWSNVALPNWLLLEKAKGCVNQEPIWGQPAQAVLFEGYEYTPQRTWYNLDVYTLTLRFTAKTAASWGTLLEPMQSGEDCFDRMGIWNRRWCQFPVNGSPMRTVNVDDQLGDTPYKVLSFANLFQYPANCS